MAYEGNKERSLEDTSTWAIAVVCLVMVFISLLLEHLLHILEKWLHKLDKPALIEALHKIKSELMLMGFISLLLTVGSGPISDICVSHDISTTWLPCAKKKAKVSGSPGKGLRRLLEFLDSGEISRRILAKAQIDKCSKKGKVAFVSAYGIDQLHYFVFVLAVFHIFYCILIYILGRTKMRKWKVWEDETKTIEYQYQNDPERFRFARDTSFGRRHLRLWSQSPIFLWIVCFFRQFFGSVTKVDYLALRHGFIMAHLAPGSETTFDFQKYIGRSLEDDFKVVVGISPVMWLIALLFILSYTHGSYSYFWLPFISLIIILLVGAKLQVIITQLGLRTQERGDVVQGAPVVQPGDELFWFGRPRLMLFLIHLVLFQNAFQLAFFIWSLWKFGAQSCFHDHLEDIIIRVTMGVIIQVVCSYVTLPLYALVTQMGSSMRPTIFNDRVAAALRNWRRTAKKHIKAGKHSASHTPMSSRPATPSYGMSPVHLLHNHHVSSSAPNSTHTSPRCSNYDNDQWDPETLNSLHYQYHATDSQHGQSPNKQDASIDTVEDSNSTQLPQAHGSFRAQHEINIGLADFTFRK